jgi:hypothetical protein
MITIRQLERLWMMQQFDRIVRLFLEMRTESSVRLVCELSRAVPAAALAVVRLDELSQAHNPFAQKMIRTIVASQEADGGWGEPMTTALCLKALLCGKGDGLAIQRAIDHLAALQRPEGLWPRVPLRRMPADPFVSAFVLFQLADEERFTRVVSTEETLAWFEANAESLDHETGRLWRAISLRRRARAEAALVWS